MSVETASIYSPSLRHYKSPYPKMRIVLVFLALFLALAVASAISIFMEQSLLERALNNEPITSEEAESNDFRQMVLGLLHFAGYIGTVIVFLSWIHRASSNMHAMKPYGVENPRFSIGWSIGWWFVPLMSWFRPHQVMRELWRRSYPDNGQPLLALMWVWWILFVVNNLMGWTSFRQSFSGPQNIETIQGQNNFLLVSAGLDAVTALLLMVIVSQISAHQVRLLPFLTDVQSPRSDD